MGWQIAVVVVRNGPDGVQPILAVDAVRNALAIQSAMAGRDVSLPDDRRIRFRVGINLGDVIVEEDDIHGDGVNVAARLEGLCGPGEIYVSGAVRDQVQGKLTASFDDLGEQALKNISRPTRVYRVGSGPTGVAVEPDEPTTAPALPSRPSVAVLPIANMSGDPRPQLELYLQGQGRGRPHGGTRTRRALCPRRKRPQGGQPTANQCPARRGRDRQSPLGREV
jgi:hypothetical protein